MHGLECQAAALPYDVQFLTEFGQASQQPIHFSGRKKFFRTSEGRNHFLTHFIAVAVRPDDLEVLVFASILDTTFLAHEHGGIMLSKVLRIK